MAAVYQPAVWLADVLHAAGCHVVEETGWRRRGLSHRLPFTPAQPVWHHDSSDKGPSPGVPSFLIRNFQVASAQFWVCLGCEDKHPIGTWHLIAAGRAPHTGVTRPNVPTNFTSIGIETDHTVGEHWHPELLGSLRSGSAAILTHLKRPAGRALWFHKTICLPPGRKIDPAGLEQHQERRRVAALMPTELPGSTCQPSARCDRPPLVRPPVHPTRPAGTESQGPDPRLHPWPLRQGHPPRLLPLAAPPRIHRRGHRRGARHEVTHPARPRPVHRPGLRPWRTSRGMQGPSLQARAGHRGLAPDSPDVYPQDDRSPRPRSHPARDASA